MAKREQRTIDPRIWDAAVRLFASKGYAATGIREIGDEAGLSLSAMYYYVANKEELLLKIMRDTQERLVAAGSVVAETLPEPAVGLAGLVKLHVMTHARTPLEARVVDTEVRALGDEGRREMVALRDQYEALWNDVLSRGAQAGSFTINNRSTARLALLEMCNGVAEWYRPEGSLGIDQLAHEFADLALALVRASRDGSPVTAGDLDLPDASWFASLAEGATLETQLDADNPGVPA